MSLDRQRAQHLRQRWAEENFRASLEQNGPFEEEFSEDVTATNPSSTQQVNDTSNRGISTLSSRSESAMKGGHRKSWRDKVPWSRASNSPAPPLPTASKPSRTLADEQHSSPVPSSPEQPVETTSAVIHPGWLNEIYILSWLTFFALLGTLARVGVEALTQYPNAPVTSRVLWANLGGSFVMGWLVKERRLFAQPESRLLGDINLKKEQRKHRNRDPEATDIKFDPAKHLKHKKTIPLYIGLSTGFCGCFTSFSSYIRDAFLALTNALTAPNDTVPYQPNPNRIASRNAGFSFLALLAILILHPAVSLAAMHGGRAFASLIDPLLRRPIPPRVLSRYLNPLAVVLGMGSWLLGAVILTIVPPGRSDAAVAVAWRARGLMPLLFAPLGCFARYYLAKHLNRPSTPNFPWGTFVANVAGTLVLGMAWDLQHAATIGAHVDGGNACAALLGVQEGFCGCLTTVSTWVVELDGLSKGRKKKWGWWYAGCSVGVALAGLIIIMGGMGWTVGFATPVCG